MSQNTILKTHHDVFSRRFRNKRARLLQSLVFSRRILVKRARILQWLVFFSSDHRPHRVCTTFYRLHSFTCTRRNSLHSVYGEPSGHGFESLFWPETFSSNFFRHCATISIFFGTVRLFSNFFFAFKGYHLQVFF